MLMTAARGILFPIGICMLRVTVHVNFHMEDAKVLLIYWYGKQYDTVKMHQKLLARVREDCPSYSTVTNWIRKHKHDDDIHQRTSGSGRSPDDHLPAFIVAALEESPFHSGRSLASAVKYPSMTLGPHLYSSEHVLPH
jgi:hypothetical protein